MTEPKGEYRDDGKSGGDIVFSAGRRTEEPMKTVSRSGHRSSTNLLFFLLEPLVPLLPWVAVALILFGPGAVTEVVGTWETPLMLLGPLVGVVLLVVYVNLRSRN